MINATYRIGIYLSKTNVDVNFLVLVQEGDNLKGYLGEAFNRELFPVSGKLNADGTFTATTGACITMNGDVCFNFSGKIDEESISGKCELVGRPLTTVFEGKKVTDAVPTSEYHAVKEKYRGV